MRGRLIPVLALVVSGAVCTTPARAQAADTAAVVRVAEALLRAISTKDTALARTTMIPGATFTAVLDPAPPATSAQMQTDAQFYGMLGGSGAMTFLERMWTPSVRFFGTSVAEVAAPYDFHMNGKFSHCGTDVFTLVQSSGTWRIASTVYTVQMKNCAPSPLGPPKP